MSHREYLDARGMAASMANQDGFPWTFARGTTPRKPTVSARCIHAAQSRSVYAGKGQETLFDGYSEPELRRIAKKLWGQTAESPAITEQCLRTLTDLLLSHYMLTRGNNRRPAEISDLFTFELSGEGPTRCMPLIFRWDLSPEPFPDFGSPQHWYSVRKGAQG
jgi:hypothetical protein